MANFQYIQPTDEQKALMQEFRDRFQALSDDIITKVPESNGFNRALVKLEEAAFWLNKGITNNS
jgi:hypothetical protein